MCPSRLRRWAAGWDSERDRAMGEITRPLCCFSWHPGGVSQLMRLNTELGGQPLCLRELLYFNAVMLQQPGSCNVRWAVPLQIITRPFVFPSALPCWLCERISSLDFKADGAEASAAWIVRGPCAERTKFEKKSTYEEEFDKCHKNHLLKCLMTM